MGFFLVLVFTSQLGKLEEQTQVHSLASMLIFDMQLEISQGDILLFLGTHRLSTSVVNSPLVVMKAVVLPEATKIVEHNAFEMFQMRLRIYPYLISVSMFLFFCI